MCAKRFAPAGHGRHNPVVKIGLVGRPRTGKTTVFNLLTGAGVATSRFETGRAALHTGVARVADVRLERLAGLVRPKKVTPVTLEIVDVAGVARGERSALLEVPELRTADALLHVVRGFSDPVHGPPAPRADIEEFETELVLADLELAERRLERLAVSLRRRRTEAEAREHELLTRLREALERGTPLRAVPLGAEEHRAVRGFTFLSQKPVLHCVNVDEAAAPEGPRALRRFGLEDLATRPHTRLTWVSAVIEAEVAELGSEEQRAFMAELGLETLARDRLLRECFALLGLVSFFTVNEEEVRAWAVPAGTRAQDAAGAVHSDMARGFIRAEVARWDELLAAGSFAELRARGHLRLEGKDYPVQDGDVCLFRFHVSR